MTNLFGEENQERLNELRKRSEPMFHEWMDCFPSWIRWKGKQDVDKLAEEYKEFSKWVEETTRSGEEYAESYQEVVVFFSPVVILPFLKTLQYWATTHLHERIITKDDVSVSAPDIVDCDTLFVFLKKLEPIVRVTGYKNIGLHSILLKKIEKAIKEDNLSLFEEILYDKSSETELLCQYFGKLSNSLSNEDDFKAIVNDKQRLLSLDFFKEVRVYLRSVRHLPKETKNKHIASFILGQMRDPVMKYYDLREEMTPGEKAIFEGLLNNPVFPVFAEYCQDLENEWLEKNRGEEIESEVETETIDSEPQPNHQPLQAPVSGDETNENTDKQQTWSPSDYKWPEREFFAENKTGIGVRYFVPLLNSIIESDLTGEDGDYERFKKFIIDLAKWGKLKNDSEISALLQYLTGRKFENASEIIHWNGEGTNARTLFYVVRHISAEKKKKKYDALTDPGFTTFGGIADDEKGILQENKVEGRVTSLDIANTIQNGKGVSRERRITLYSHYPTIFPNPNA